jgi:hypothetical protein
VGVVKEVTKVQIEGQMGDMVGFAIKRIKLGNIPADDKIDW